MLDEFKSKLRVDVSGYHTWHVFSLLWRTMRMLHVATTGIANSVPTSFCTVTAKLGMYISNAQTKHVAYVHMNKHSKRSASLQPFAAHSKRASSLRSGQSVRTVSAGSLRDGVCLQLRRDPRTIGNSCRVHPTQIVIHMSNIQQHMKMI